MNDDGFLIWLIDKRNIEYENAKIIEMAGGNPNQFFGAYLAYDKVIQKWQEERIMAEFNQKL